MNQPMVVGDGGIVAAGALYALDHHRARLAEDHDNAKVLATGLADIPGVSIDAELVQTNIVHFDVQAGQAHNVEAKLAERDVMMFAVSADTLRAVTSMRVNRDQIEQALGALRDAVA